MMKKKLESELVSIAHRILKLKGKEDVKKLHAETLILLEKLSVLKFAYENFDGDKPTIGKTTIIEMLEKTTTISNEESDKETEKTPSPTPTHLEEPNSQTTDNPDDFKKSLEALLPKPKYQKNDFEDLMSNFVEMPIFDPVPKTSGHSNEKKSLNDTIKKGGFNIGLNDKLAFIKHLFEGKNEDYERVMSQLNSFNSHTEAKNFLLEIVKPDYNNWANKEEVEERFIQILEIKFS